MRALVDLIRRWRRHWPIPAALLALLLCACGPGLAPGYRTLTLGARIGNQAEAQLGAACKAQRLACEARHPVGDLRTACELPCLKALRAWDVAKRSYNAAAETTWGGLEIARLAGKDKADWIGMIKVGACAMLKAVGELRPLLGAKVTEWIASLGSVQGLVCGGAT